MGFLVGALPVFSLGMQEAAAACEKPNLLFVLDKSGSMLQNNKWTQAKQGITSATNSYGSKIQFGLETFSTNASINAGIPSTPSVIQTALNGITPAGDTYMVKAVNTARAHLETVLKADPVNLRPTNLLFITDGAPTDKCPTTEVNALRSLKITKGGKTYTYDIKTYVLGFGAQADPRCLNNLAVAGGTALSGTLKYYLATDLATLTSAISKISNTATKEICNGLDDDCDGSVDEDFANKGNTCSAGRGECKASGKYVCNTAGTGVTCDAKPKAPSTETCDGKDNDCDGQVDEDFSNKGKTCAVGKGDCRRTSKYQCKSDGSALECPATPGTPKAETCDNKDNDCDGYIDNAAGNNKHYTLGQACTTACGKGTQTCNRGNWGACSTAPKTDVCDGKDNDCDGKVDNKAGTSNPLTKSCKKGLCNGTQTCSSGAWASCQPTTPATSEICNNKDDDCDGSVDESLTQACSTKCGSGTERCSAGQWVSCTAPKPVSETCDGKDNDCDGKIDNISGTGNPLSRGCKAGRCSGTQVCSSGAWAMCKPNSAPTAETCNRKDDDCDGYLDNAKGVNKHYTLTQACTTACGKGTQTCRYGNWGACSTAPRTDVCNGKDDDCDGKIDNIRNSSNPLKRNCTQGRCAGTQICKTGVWQSCSPNTAPTAEVCNNKDDDCDGSIDEGLTQACSTKCGSGTERCSAGQWVSCTAPKPVTETCDGKDNDCDGKVDNVAGTSNDLSRSCRKGRCYGKQSCQSGSWAACQPNPPPTAEVCNNKDDDCDGYLDNDSGVKRDYSLTQPCSTICGAGTQTCRSGKWRTCSSAPKTESCNGKDDDCDGQIDNKANTADALTRGCSAGKCAGTQACASGKWGTCQANSTPKPETCNKLDDDCDGYIDNASGQKKSNTLTQSCTTACGTGSQTCNSGKWGTCSTAPKTETCNGKDDDCDGQIDNVANSNNPLTKNCSVGRCAGTQACQIGKWDTCKPKTPPTAETCNRKDDDCDGYIDNAPGTKKHYTLTQACTTVCGKGTETCRSGKWRNCTSAPKTETCNGKDDDCDGKIDETWKAWLGPPARACKKDCTTGVYQCRSDGKGVVCGAPGKRSEICNDKDDDCDGKIDENWSKKLQICFAGSGACQKTGLFVCRPDGKNVECSVKAPDTPSAEVCDGIDNDCDGRTDENITRPCKTNCGTGVETCQEGTWSKCAGAKQPEPEKCDNKDNDCNGKVDDLVRPCQTKCGKGTEACVAGKWQTCSASAPTTESCNGKDDDCDGQIDENLKQDCSTACGKGTEQCLNGKWVFCDATQPEKEICDNKDNDCNGEVDELGPKQCSGACGTGTANCIDGKWTGCSGPQPEPEICDGKDNDCNGKIDDGLERLCRTACGEGTEVCENGAWGICSAPRAGAEACDGKDNDCDGKVDNDAQCPVGYTCRLSACRLDCRGGECPGGMRCVNGSCLSNDPCQGVKCVDGYFCKNDKCVDKCETLQCPDDQVCVKGACYEKNCYAYGCPTGERCVSGKCEVDPCVGASCTANQYCSDGNCVDICQASCPEGQRCVDNKCEDDPCGSVTCNDGDICVDGKCETNQCKDVTCPGGRICVDGTCEHDPCFNIKCPLGSQCKAGKCILPPIPSNPEFVDENVIGEILDYDAGILEINRSDGGFQERIIRKQVPGGCGCTTDNDKMPVEIFLFALVVMFAAGVRRQRRP